jgi:hypothetical protein
LASNMTAELQTNVPFLLRQIDLEGWFRDAQLHAAYFLTKNDQPVIETGNNMTKHQNSSWPSSYYQTTIINYL